MTSHTIEYAIPFNLAVDYSHMEGEEDVAAIFNLSFVSSDDEFAKFARSNLGKLVKITFELQEVKQ